MLSTFNKILIIGNSGSGKTTLSKILCHRFNYPLVHLDLIFWKDDHFTEAHTKEEARSRLENHLSHSRWITEGVFGDLASVAAVSADLLIFLNLDRTVCIQALHSRGPNGATKEGFNDLITWAENYWDRKTASSFHGHQMIYNDFLGDKIELKTREEVEVWIKGQY